MTGREQARRLPDAGPAIDAYRAGLAAHEQGREQRCFCGRFILRLAEAPQSCGDPSCRPPKGREQA